MKNKILSLAALITLSVGLNANILPNANQFQLGLGAKSYNETTLKNFATIDDSFSSNVSPTIGYGINNWFSASYNYSRVDVEQVANQGESKTHQLNLNWNTLETPLFRITSSAGLAFIEQNFSNTANNVEGTALNLNGTAYLSIYPFVSPYASLGILGNPEDARIYEDTMTEHIGFVVSPTPMTDIVVDYEFSYKALSYGVQLFF